VPAIAPAPPSVPLAGRDDGVPPSTLIIPTVASAPGQQLQIIPAQPGENGLQITEVLDGPAKDADLRVGDIILGVGPNRTQNLEELTKAIAAASDNADIIFINGDSKRVERLPVTPRKGKIGVVVSPIKLDGD
jgi:hypothetical protein